MTHNDRPARFHVTPYPSIQLREIVWRFREVEGLPVGFDRSEPITSPDHMIRYRFLFEGFTTERFVVFILNAKNVVQGVEVVSEGTLNSSLVHPREVFRSAVLGLGASIIVAHNHPSGNREPSAEDIKITKQLVEAGKILGIPVHDHIIFAESEYTSFAERGLI